MGSCGLDRRCLTAKRRRRSGNLAGGRRGFCTDSGRRPWWPPVVGSQSSWPRAAAHGLNLEGYARLASRARCASVVADPSRRVAPSAAAHPACVLFGASRLDLAQTRLRWSATAALRPVSWQQLAAGSGNIPGPDAPAGASRADPPPVGPISGGRGSLRCPKRQPAFGGLPSVAATTAKGWGRFFDSRLQPANQRACPRDSGWVPPKTHRGPAPPEPPTARTPQVRTSVPHQPCPLGPGLLLSFPKPVLLLSLAKFDGFRFAFPPPPSRPKRRPQRA